MVNRYDLCSNFPRNIYIFINIDHDFHYASIPKKKQPGILSKLIQYRIAHL